MRSPTTATCALVVTSGQVARLSSATGNIAAHTRPKRRARKVIGSMNGSPALAATNPVDHSTTKSAGAPAVHSRVEEGRAVQAAVDMWSEGISVAARATASGEVWLIGSATAP